MRHIITACIMLCNSIIHAQNINTVAGGGTSLGDGGPATMGQLGLIASTAIDSAGNIYIADINNHRIRKVDVATNTITTICGNGTAAFSGDGGPALAAQLNSPQHLAFDKSWNLYVSDVLNRRIRKIDLSGTITTVAGNGIMAYSGDGGMATAASVYTPQGIAFDGNGNLYYADMGGFCVRKIDLSGIITTYAGNGTYGYSGDAGGALLAQLKSPRSLTFDTANNLYIADADNNRIRKVDATSGFISTYAGNATGGYTGDEIPATASGLSAPFGVYFHNNGTLYIADRSNHRVRTVDNSGIIHTVTGSGTNGFSGDGGVATLCQLYFPMGVTIDKCGNLYIADHQNMRIRKVTFNPYATPTVSLAAVASAAAGTTVTVTATIAAGTGAYTIQWYRNSVPVATTTTPTYTYTKPPGTDTITATIAPAVGYCSAPATATAILVAELPVGIDNPTGPAPLLLYPNPTHAVLHLQAATPILQATLHTITGSMVHTTTPGTHTTTIDIAALPPGMYLLRINGLHTYKVVKQ
jgi:hypothetical protein